MPLSPDVLRARIDLRVCELRLLAAGVMTGRSAEDVRSIIGVIEEAKEGSAWSSAMPRRSYSPREYPAVDSTRAALAGSWRRARLTTSRARLEPRGSNRHDREKTGGRGGEIAPEPTGHGLPLGKCEAYNRVYDQRCGSS